MIPEQQENAVGPATIELWFEFGSSYSYLSVMRIEQLAAGLGVTVQWRPFLLGPIFKSFGWSTSPFVVQTWKTEYVWRDMERECRKYGLAWTRPTAFPRTALLPARVATSCGCAIKLNSPEPREYSVRPHSSWARTCSGAMTVSMTRWLTAEPGALAERGTP